MKNKTAYKVHGLNQDGLKDIVKINAYSKRQARWIAIFFKKFKFINDVIPC